MYNKAFELGLQRRHEKKSGQKNNQWRTVNGGKHNNFAGKDIMGWAKGEYEERNWQD